MSAPPPAIVLAYANDKQAPLDALKAEQSAIEEVLLRLQAKELIQVFTMSSATAEKIQERFDNADMGPRIAIFHYAGHASGDALFLEGRDGVQAAHAEGLAMKFGLAKGLKLVFLNGCATRGQVDALLASNVNAVIATSAPVDDEIATRFSTGFYYALTQGQTLEEAFLSAKANVATERGTDQRPDAYRSLAFQLRPGATGKVFSWELYPQGEAGAPARSWKLPEAPRPPPPPEENVAQEDAMEVNRPLREMLANGLADNNPAFKQMLAANPDPFFVRDLIADTFPWPIGEQLRKLFTRGTVDGWGQRQVRTYETTLRLFTFTMLSQLWDVRTDNPQLPIPAEDRAMFASLLDLPQAGVATFDYLHVTIAAARLIRAWGVQPVMPECQDLEKELTDAPTRAAQTFMEGQRGRSLEGLSAAEAEKLCEEADEHLATALTDFAFVTRYKATTIRSIEIRKFRAGAPSYIHREFALDRATRPSSEISAARDTFTDSGSVLLKFDRADGSGFVNLTPFVLDDSALGAGSESNLYFLSWRDAENDAYHYASLVDPSVELVIRARPRRSELAGRNAEAVTLIKSMLDDFRATVLDA